MLGFPKPSRSGTLREQPNLQMFLTEQYWGASQMCKFIIFVVRASSTDRSLIRPTTNYFYKIGMLPLNTIGRFGMPTPQEFRSFLGVLHLLEKCCIFPYNLTPSMTSICSSKGCTCEVVRKRNGIR
jgi:hypothetical protein